VLLQERRKLLHMKGLSDLFEEPMIARVARQFKARDAGAEIRHWSAAAQSARRSS
jgi:hypothetical protein